MSVEWVGVRKVTYIACFKAYRARHSPADIDGN
jgi:hypothetical protein